MSNEAARARVTATAIAADEPSPIARGKAQRTSIATSPTSTDSAFAIVDTMASMPLSGAAAFSA